MIVNNGLKLINYKWIDVFWGVCWDDWVSGKCNCLEEFGDYVRSVVMYWFYMVVILVLKKKEEIKNILDVGGYYKDVVKYLK